MIVTLTLVALALWRSSQPALAANAVRDDEVRYSLRQRLLAALNARLYSDRF